MRKNPHAVALGRKGGKSRSRAKRQAARRNAAHARQFLVTKKRCKLCKRKRLAARNKSGICRECQNAGARGQVLGVRGKRRR